MAKFYLKDWHGKEKEFTDDKIFVRGEDGELIQFTQGEGASPDVRYVTFMSYDGLTEYGKKAVAVGDDCADPIARGIFATPTRESDAQYNYTFYGWATTANGAADSNALKAVTEDKTVYANFAAAVRYYTITFYDEDGTTVLTTQSVAYGSVPDYTPTKDDYDFSGWNPALSAVTGEASYTATWTMKAAFATASWAEISAITTAGTSASCFALGDTKTDILTYSDGTTEEIEWVIVKIRDDGTMVLALNHALATLKQMNSGTAVANYFNNALGKYITDTIVPALSEDFSAVVRTPTVMYANRKLRLPTSRNLTSTGSDTSIDYEPLPWFTASQSRRVRKRKADGVAVTYWHATWKESYGAYKFGYVQTDGSISDSYDVVTERGVVLLADI